MFCKERRCARGKVALHAESVDRNIVAAVLANKDDNVALHAESVDRNTARPIGNKIAVIVALHAESVDRNLEKST